MRGVLITALLLALGAAHAAEVPRDGVALDPDDRGGWVLTAGPDGALPPGLRIGVEGVDELSIRPEGVLVADGALIRLGAPGSLTGLPLETVLAPLWAPLEIGACDDGPEGEVRVTTTDVGVRVAWHDMPLAGCPTDERATFSIELAVEQGALRAVTMRYATLPADAAVIDGAAVEPRAGINLRQGRDDRVVVELLPDPDDRALRGRAKLLEEGSSDGEPGVWIIELNPEGQILGDPDLDGRRSIDNCEDDFNPLQEDLDGDGSGDVCDIDDDGDRVRDVADNCPRVADADQTDLDLDGLGDPCDPDDDDDGWRDEDDLCPRVFDRANLDLDGDGRGDACDRDPDGDAGDQLGVLWRDICPWAWNPAQKDSDRDGLGDACDLEPRRLCRGSGCAAQLDSDGDGLGDRLDLCPRTPEVRYRDQDGDGLGDACDPDSDGDGVIDAYQLRDDWRFDPGLIAQPPGRHF